jgi:hypothetical protein
VHPLPIGCETPSICRLRHERLRGFKKALVEDCDAISAAERFLLIEKSPCAGAS